MKKYIIISGLILKDTNRGTAALGYGSFSFLKEKGYLTDNHEFITIQRIKKFWNYKDKVEVLNIQGCLYKMNTLYVTELEYNLYMKTGLSLPFTKFGKAIRNIDFVACINGGDGFSDIYNTDTFYSRLGETMMAMKSNIPVIQLPQTLGPFNEEKNYRIAEEILKYSSKVYVRDDKFVPELNKMGIQYELTKDLSAFMQPEPWNIEIKPDSIGINVSGLCYSNKFRTLSGQFEQYPELIDRLIRLFQSKGKTIYLIPHSYRYGNPEENNDDMVACRLAYDRLEDKTNVIFVDKDLISPQVKYVISKMSFFIGTRMHANFAAIYTDVPLFGLAYSYKFAGAFNANGLDGDKQTAMVNNIKREEMDGIIQRIESFYQESIKK